MPELPEVETVLRGLRKRALGRQIVEVEVLHPGIIAGDVEDFIQGVEGMTVVAVQRKGKVLAVEMAGANHPDPNYLILRLGMTGQVTIQPIDVPLESHTHIRMAFEGRKLELRFRDVRRFGRLRCLKREEFDALFASLGPDAQQATEEEFLRAMSGRRGAIKSWLLNQQGVSGLGNIYADEALFEAGIHPLAQPAHVSSVSARRLYRAVQKVLKRAVNLQGTTFRDYIDIEGRPGNFHQHLRVYQKTGGPCPRCQTSIRRIIIAGRSSHFCPRCQRRPKHVARMRGPRTSDHELS
ncbi:MAG TPA: bifunctional DNA-formamidopyrimidine glycosylase/DNA-(apurinic or apyrimidinic site) lyase [Terriglobia bacterium]|nr:bifunctional DNA-formamidopyrimidine glycosylase/DNA-(apurinic or apyrimidinic site) lyase [Terriglobia bacterium]